MRKDLLVPVVAGCVIQKDGKYLLVQEKLPKAYGLWNLPAGHVDEGETFETAAKREVLEETGLIVELEQKLITAHQAVDRPVMHAYQARIVGGSLKFDPNELLGVQWFTFEEIEQLKAESRLRNVWVLESIQQVAAARPQMHESGKATPYIEDMLSGKKTVEGRLARGKFLNFHVGDIVNVREDLYENDVEVGTIPNRMMVKITKVDAFPTFDAMLKAIGYVSAIPRAMSHEEALAEYHKHYRSEDEQEYGVLAIHFKVLAKA